MSHLQILPSNLNHGPHSRERYLLEIRNRYRWLAEMGAERVLLYKRRFEGTRCPLFDLVRKTSPQHGQDNLCQGTGYISSPLTASNTSTNTVFTISNISGNDITIPNTAGMAVGNTITQGTFTTTVTAIPSSTKLTLASVAFTSSGYFKPIEIVFSLVSGGEDNLVVEEYGRRRIYKPRSWTLWEPLLTPGDFIVRRNNQRFEITQTYQRRWKHFVTRQDVELNEIERNSPIYQISTGL